MVKTYSSLLLFLFSFVTPFTLSHAAWSGKCLEDCFSTRHDCNFCAYQCTVEPKPSYPYVSQLPCPLDGVEITHY